MAPPTYRPLEQTGRTPSLWSSIVANRNVWMAIVYTVLLQSGQSVLTGTVFVVFIFSLPGGSNARVGAVSAVSGLVQMAVALPAGALTDKLPRARILKFGGVVGALAIALSLAALSLAHGYYIFFASQALWGVYAGVTDSALNSLFADSTPTGRRTAIFSFRGALNEGAQSIGPLIVLVLFAATGNAWTLETMRWILCFGAVLLAAPVALLFFFSDTRSLGLASESALAVPSARESPTAGGRRAGSADSGDEAGAAEAERQRACDKSADEAACQGDLARADTGTDSHGELVRVNTSARIKRTANSAYGRFLGLSVAHVPFLILTSDVMFSLAAGMTIPYLGLFFFNEFGLSPIGLQVIFALVPITTFIVIQLGSYVSRFAGRVPTMFASRYIGIAALFAMCFVKPFLLVATLLIVRTSFQRVATPMMRSILMDVVPKRSRGRWNALEGINSASFTGSAFVGGYLIDHYSYRTAFLVTAVAFIAATLVWVPMLFILPRDETAMAIDADTGAEAVPLTEMGDVDAQDQAADEPLDAVNHAEHDDERACS